jgi:hypothetical protein
MSEMIEHVARAINAELFRQGVIVNFGTVLARAAIESMREPTEAMYEAGGMAEGEAPDLWRAMIDAALAEKP